MNLVKERSKHKRAVWVCCSLHECEGLRNVADTKEPCGNRQTLILQTEVL